jgi:hypothetical protein
VTLTWHSGVDMPAFNQTQGPVPARREPGRCNSLAKRLLRVVVLLSFGMCFELFAQTAPTAPTAEQVKAAYLQKFPNFVTWPDASFADSSAPIVIGTRGADPVFQEMAKLATGQAAQGRPLVVRRLSEGAPPGDLHVLYIGPQADPATVKTWSALAARHVLVVTDGPDGLERGGVLNFVQSGGKVRFEVSLSAAQRAELKLSSRLLGVAERVTGSVP